MSQVFSPGSSATREVSASNLLNFMKSNDYVTTLEGGKVTSFPRHNIQCPVTLAPAAPVRVSTDEVRRVKVGARSPLSLVVGAQPSRQLVSTITKVQGNVVILSDLHSGEAFNIPGYRKYREGSIQVSVHSQLNIERLRGQRSGGGVLWLALTEPRLLKVDGVTMNRVTLIGVVASLAASDEQQLSCEAQTISRQFSSDDHLDFLLIMLEDSVRTADQVQIQLEGGLGRQMRSLHSSDVAIVANRGVDYEVEERDGTTTIKQDKRYCSIFEQAFRTRAELEAHTQSSKYQKAKLYRFYQLNKSKLLQSPHELGLELEVVEQDAGVEVGVGDENGVVTIVAKPKEVKKLKIRLKNVRQPEGPEELNPGTPKGIILDRFGIFGREDSVFSFEDDKGLVGGTKLRLKYEKKMRVTVRASSPQIGHYRVPVLVGFYHEIHSPTQYDVAGNEAHVLQHMGLELLLKVQTDEMKDLRPKAPFVAKKKVTPWRVQNTVPGARLEYDESLDQLPKQLQLEHFNIEKKRDKVISNNFQEFDFADLAEKTEFEKCQKLLEEPLSVENYKERWQLLLHCEEKQLQTDIRHYDMSGVILTKNNNLFSLNVPGLEENRPSVMKGDKIFVKHSSDEGRDYEGFVHQIQEQRVLIGFGSQFKDNFLRNMKFDVRFTLSRFPLRNMHRAVSLAGASGDLIATLFPRSERLAVLSSLPDVRCYNRNIEENPQQLSAVKHILAGTSGGCPYLVFGPPGTGKTVTLVETIKQLVKRDGDVYILASAPSNTAADLITERLLQHLNKKEIIRIHASSRVVSNIPERVVEVSNVVGDKVTYPRLEELTKYKVIVTTLVTAGRLVTAKFPVDHFSHIVMDETGQATEPEAAVALSGLLGIKAKLVMAGDPKQLGPVIRSVAAAKHGMTISLLERLMESELYSRDSSGHYNTR